MHPAAWDEDREAERTQPHRRSCRRCGLWDVNPAARPLSSGEAPVEREQRRVQCPGKRNIELGLRGSWVSADRQKRAQLVAERRVGIDAVQLKQLDAFQGKQT